MKLRENVVICAFLSIILIQNTVTAFECVVNDFQNYADSTRDCIDVKSLTFNLSSTKNWGTIPQDLINRTKFVHSILVTNQNIINLDNKGFCAWPNLTSIIADMNNITSLTARMFTGCRFLTTLSLSRNNISEIYDDAFHGLSLLTTLDLSNNQIHALSGNVFHSLISLRTLQLNNNQIGAIDADIFSNNLKLQDLDLSFNKVVVIEKGSFWKLKRLSTLDISSNPDLNEIDLSEMDRLNDVFVNNASLTSLHIPDFVTRVNADSNKITTLNIAENSLLEELSLRHNFIQNLQNIQQAVLLTSLDLTDNNITEIDFSHLMGTQIQRIVILDNPIKSLNVKSLTSLQHLHSIEISLNSLDNQTLTELDSETREKRIALIDPNRGQERGIVITESPVTPVPAKDINPTTTSTTPSTAKTSTVEPNDSISIPTSDEKKDSLIKDLLKRIRSLELSEHDTSGVHNEMLENVSNLRIMIVCTIVAFSLFVSFQIAIFVSSNYKRWQISIPNVFSNTNGTLSNNHRQRANNGSLDPMMEEIL